MGRGCVRGTRRDGAATRSTARWSSGGTDRERGLRGGAGIPQAEWRRTDEEAHRRVAALLADGRDVLVDDTSSPRLLRDRWRDEAAAAGAGFRLVYVRADAALVTARARENRRTRLRPDVTDVVLADHLASFEAPAADEPHLVVDGTSRTAAEQVLADLRC